MKQGTSAELTFTLPMEASLLTKLWISFGQGDSVVLEKELTEDKTGFYIEGRKVNLSLTPAETAGFTPGDAYIELTGESAGTRWKSVTIPIHIDRAVRGTENE